MTAAIVTVKFRIDNLGDESDWADSSFEEMVRWLIHEEGLMGIVDDTNGQIVRIEKEVDE
jgi:hypothetical protein